MRLEEGTGLEQRSPFESNPRLMQLPNCPVNGCAVHDTLRHGELLGLADLRVEDLVMDQEGPGR